MADVRKQVTTTKTVSIQVTHDELLQAIMHAAHPTAERPAFLEHIPEQGAIDEAFVHVPGGEWSHRILHIGIDAPLTLKYTTETRS